MRMTPFASMSFLAATAVFAVGGAGCGDWQSVVDDILKHSGDHSSPPSSGGTCDYGGKPYPLGSSFPSKDGCNTCQCDKNGVSCTLRACGGGGNAGTSSCEKVPVTADSGECVPVSTWKASSTELCAARGAVLNDLRPADTCEDGQSSRQVILVCCQAQPANDVQCKPTVDAAGRNCTVCVDASGSVIKTDCREK